MKKKSMSSKYSKYDLVKVKVFLSSTHYYILSRFLISRVLTAINVIPLHAVRMALDIKKYFVDRNLLCVSQEDLESVIFAKMGLFSYKKNIQLYKMLSDFHISRSPLIILVGGISLIGKSYFATMLSQRMNMSSVLNTDIIHCLKCKNKELQNYEDDCRVVCSTLEFELEKCISEGKSLIIEGLHVRDYLLNNLLPKGFQGIIISFILTANAETYRNYVSDFVSEEKRENFIKENMKIQELMVSEKHQLSLIINVNNENVDSTLDEMHQIVLEKVKIFQQ